MLRVIMDDQLVEPDVAIDRPPRGWPVATLTLLAALGALGSAVMTLAHLGIELSLLTLFGPARLIPTAAIGFATGTCLFVAVAVAVWRRWRRAWPLAVVVNLVALVTAAMPFRNWMSGAAIIVSLAALAVLASRAGRGALR